MNRWPDESTATPTGKLNCADVAGPPSPEKPPTPAPATALIPPEGSTLRTRLLLESAMYSCPALTATSAGESSLAAVAEPPSPELTAAPVPATVLTTPDWLILRTRLFP